jgi:hypothetical protein
MKKYFYNALVFSLLIILIDATIVFSQEKQNNYLGEPSSAYLSRNYISTVLKNNGISDINIEETNSGFVYPKGSGKTAVFQSGFIWGGIVESDSTHPKLGGSQYISVLQPGKIISPGIAEDPNLAKNRIYRVRKDVYPNGPAADLSSELTDGEGTESEIRLQYESDWNEWPAIDGAPYEDINNNGTYESSIDVPGYPGADQTIWFVANDLDSSLYDYPMSVGIELQVSIWSYKMFNHLGNVFFKKFRMINKSAESFDSVYVAFWSDPDVGNSTDDFAGCDTTLNLGYAYNGENFDKVYEFTPPAVGYMLMQGAVVPGIAGEDKNRNGIDDQLDYAYREGERSGQGFINLPMTAFAYFTRGDAQSPPNFSPWSEMGSMEYYRFMKGRVGLTGDPFFNPVTSEPTTYCLTGDPLTQEGWVDGLLQAPGDRRIMSSSGPFNLAVGDTQDVIFCELGALGIDRWNSIKILRFYASLTKDAFDNNFDFIRVPEIPQLPLNTKQNLSSIDLWWDEDESLLQQVEGYEESGYSFQGYNVYQLYNQYSFKVNAKRLATFDRVDGVKEIQGIVMNPETGFPMEGTEQFGTDSGIERRFVVQWDSINNIYLMPGRTYNFLVTAYAYNPDPGENPFSFESVIGEVEITFQDTLNEIQYGDTLEVIHTAGIGDPIITPLVVDPYKLTGHSYKIDFDTLSFSEDLITVWDLTDITIDSLLLDNQQEFITNYTAPVIDGFQLKINNELMDIKRLSLTSNGNGPVTSAVGYDVTQPPPFNGYSADFYRDARDGDGSIFELPGNQAAGGFYFCVARPSIIDHESAVNDWTRYGSRLDRVLGNKYEIRFTEAGGKAWMAYTTASLVDVPFELWFLGNDIEDTADDIRMFPWIFDYDENDLFDFKLDHSASSDTNDPYCDFIYFEMPGVNAQPGEQAYYDLLSLIEPNPQNWSGEIEIEHIARFVLMNWNQLQGSGGENEFPETGTTFLIEFPNPVVPGVDEFEFASKVLDTTKYFIPAPEKFALYQNYPNPFNPYTIIRFDVVGNSRVQLLIYDILGQRVQALIDAEYSNGRYSAQFNGRRFASGVYIYQIIVDEINTGRKFIDAKKMLLLK